MGSLSWTIWWVQCNHKVLIRERQEDQCQRRRCNYRKERSERFEDTTLMALKIEEGVASQGEQAASRSWKKSGNRFFPRVSRRNTALPTS